MSNNLTHIYTRFQTSGSAVYLATDMKEVSNAVEVQNFMLILDNEVEQEETAINLSKNSYEIFKEFFESKHGKDLGYINTDDFDTDDDEFGVIMDNGFAMLCIEKEKGDKPMYFATLMERGKTGQECTMEISEKVFNEFKKLKIGVE